MHVKKNNNYRFKKITKKCKNIFPSLLPPCFPLNFPGLEVLIGLAGAVFSLTGGGSGGLSSNSRSLRVNSII